MILASRPPPVSRTRDIYLLNKYLCLYIWSGLYLGSNTGGIGNVNHFLAKSSTAHNELKRGKNPFRQDNALFASKANINIF